MTTILKIKLENTVNNPAIPGKQGRPSYDKAKQAAVDVDISRLRTGPKSCLYKQLQVEY